MRVEFRHNAGEHERFAPEAFARQIGKEIPIKLNDERIATARIMGAEVIDDGRAVLLSCEVDDPTVLAFIRDGVPDLVGPGLSFQTWPAQAQE
jgi:hypothetical protein